MKVVTTQCFVVFILISDITLDNRKSNVKRRAICIHLWESYRVEATCVATVYPIFIHKLCYTKTEYFSRTFCFNGTFK